MEVGQLAADVQETAQCLFLEGLSVLRSLGICVGGSSSVLGLGSSVLRFTCSMLRLSVLRCSGGGHDESRTRRNQAFGSSARREHAIFTHRSLNINVMGISIKPPGQYLFASCQIKQPEMWYSSYMFNEVQPLQELDK